MSRIDRFMSHFAHPVSGSEVILAHSLARKIGNSQRLIDADNSSNNNEFELDPVTVTLPISTSEQTEKLTHMEPETVIDISSDPSKI